MIDILYGVLIIILTTIVFFAGFLRGRQGLYEERRKSLMLKLAAVRFLRAVKEHEQEREKIAPYFRKFVNLLVSNTEGEEDEKD